MKALLPLTRLTDLGIAVLLLHHPGKGKPLPGQAARGSGALPGFADILVEMSWCSTDSNDRRRKLLAFSRYESTPGQCIIELNPEGTDYTTLGDFQENEFRQNWSTLKMVLEDAPGKRTRMELLADWPADFPKPSGNTLYLWLKRGVAVGLVHQEGDGRKSDPFRYWLSDQEAKWKQSPLYQLEQQAKESQQWCDAELKKIMNRPIPTLAEEE
jgi:hypothetical protein